MDFNTPDLCDQFPEQIRVATPLFRHFGARRRFSGRVETIKYQDNVLIREAVVTRDAARCS
jgi:regulator of ribonuclease activity A